MRKTDNGLGPTGRPSGRQPERAPLPDLALYERLINDGIVAADGRGGTVDHLTARRLALWLAARPQEPDFTQNLGRFADTGRISPRLKMQLRWRARSAAYTDRAQVARMLDYCIDRGTDLGPISQDFGAACDQIDHADTMLARLHDRAREGLAFPRQTWPETDGPDIIALARRNSDSQTVSLILDATPPTPPCSPSPPTPTNAKPTSAKSSATAKPSPKTPTAAATAKPSPPAKPE